MRRFCMLAAGAAMAIAAGHAAAADCKHSK